MHLFFPNDIPDYRVWKFYVLATQRKHEVLRNIYLFGLFVFSAQKINLGQQFEKYRPPECSVPQFA